MAPKSRPLLTPKRVVRWGVVASLGALVVMSSLTIRATWSFGDEYFLYAYGAPFAWHHFSGVSSLESTIHWPALVVDMAAHIAVTLAIVFAFRRRLPPISRGMTTAAVTVQLVILLLANLPVFLDAHAPHGADYVVTGRHLHVGWSFPYGP